MAVYVDDMYKYQMGQYRRMKMSHMIADTEEELHQMADKIGVARRWYQGDHYDICMSKRALAVQFGAKEIPIRELSRMAIGKRRVKNNRALLLAKLREYLAEKRRENAVENVMKTLVHIVPWKEKHKGKTVSEIVECPICDGELHLTMHKNGHVHGKCDTEGCVKWME